MSRQERTARRQRVATAQAGRIIEQAATEARAKRVKCRVCHVVGERGKLVHRSSCRHYEVQPIARIVPDQKPAKPTAPPPSASPSQEAESGDSDDLTARVRELRDSGKMAWAKIGAALGLPGAKNGAGQARRLYAQTNGGEVPRTLAPRRGSTPRLAGPGRNGSELDRKIAMAEGKPQFTDDHSDEEVLAAVQGRVIRWAIDIKELAGGKGEPMWMTEEARVHPVDCIIDEELDKYGGRTLRFREFFGYEKDSRTGEVRSVSGPTRTVRINTIYTVR